VEKKKKRVTTIAEREKKGSMDTQLVKVLDSEKDSASCKKKKKTSKKEEKRKARETYLS